MADSISPRLGEIKIAKNKYQHQGALTFSLAYRRIATLKSPSGCLAVLPLAKR